MAESTSIHAAIVTDADIKAGYAIDSSLGAQCDGDFTLVRARDLDDVVTVLRHAHATHTPVVPQGARTGLAGGSVAIPGGIVLNLEGLGTVTEIDPIEGIAVCGPGTVNADLKAAAAQQGLWYAPDPASSASCTIGGNVATNAGGLCCVKYGVTADHIRGLQVVLASGEVITTGRRTSKGVAGLDLTGLFVGSEGTLGVVTEVVARLIPRPEPPLTVLAIFDSMAALTRAIVALRLEPHRPSLIEVLDSPTMAAIQALGDYGYPTEATAVLLVQSDRAGHTAEDIARYAQVLEAAGATDIATADDPQEAELLMGGRRMLNPGLEAKGHRFLEDICVPIIRLGDLIEAAHRVGAAHGIEVTTSGHGGDGNLHPSFFFDPDLPDGPGSRAAAETAFGELVTVALAMGGTISGEHGIGTLKARWLEQEVGPASLQRQRDLKHLFDPTQILNPGRVYWS